MLIKKEEWKNTIESFQKAVNQKLFKRIGYSEWNYYYNNEKTRKETIELIKQNSRHYAKRQITWFKKNKQTIWIGHKDLQKILDEM